MKKDGTIIIIDTDQHHCNQISNSLKASGHKNKCVGFTDAAEAANYLRDNIADMFLLLQNSATPGVVIANTRNMVYLHESFDTNKLPYMLLILTEPEQDEPQHTFVHCYYKPDSAEGLAETLSKVSSFWKEQVFPPRVRPFA